MSPPSTPLQIEDRHRVRTLTLDRPEALTAFAEGREPGFTGL